MLGFSNKVLLASLIAGVAIGFGPLAAHAQQAVTIDGVNATRVVIAPPRTPLAQLIRDELSSLYTTTPKDTRAYTDAQQLYFFYGGRHFEPLWLTEDSSGKLAFSPAALKILEVFKKAEYEGLRPSDYVIDPLAVSAAQGNAEKTAALETAFTSATMRYAQDTYGGRINPRTVSANIDVTPHRVDQRALMAKLSASDAPDQVLLALEPKHREFQALKAALAKAIDGAAEQSITIPEGPLLKVGAVDERVPLLRKRLSIATALEGNDFIYDQGVADAVAAFQDGLGLQADGVTGPATVAALNGGSAVSRDDLIANMERWRWMPEDLGELNVFVNLPEFRLAVQHGDGDVAYTTRVVIGKPDTQTPVFSDNIRHIVVNPYWNVPSSIANNEIRPHLLANPYYLQSQNMELLYGGKVVNAAAIDWSQTGMSNFSVRQKPGAGNALGNVKFLFPNSHDVYLHDTPSKSLFARSMRAYSHGCVRVQNPMDFANALLVEEPGINASTLEAMYGPSERWVNLKTHIPVHLAYFTLRVDEDGTIRSYADVYGHNKKLIQLMAQ